MAGASRNVDPDSPFVIDEGSPSLSGLEGHYGQDDLDAIEADDPIRNSDRVPLTSKISPDRPSSREQPTFSGQGESQPFATSISSNYLSSHIPGEDRRAPRNTIDESVWATVSRDLLAVWEKMRQVLWPKYLLGGVLTRRPGGMGGAADNEEAGYMEGHSNSASSTVRRLVGRWPDAETVLQGAMSDGLRDWDLWGPLIFCLLLSMCLSFRHGGDDSSLIFSGVFALVWIGEAIVTTQIKLLGGNISFFQSVSIIGYTLFPLVVASALSAIGIPMIPRIPVYLVLVAWSLAAGVSILGGSGVVPNRVALAVYPLFIFYVTIGCLCFIS